MTLAGSRGVAQVCSKNQISVDIFCCCEHYADLATISPLCKYTNGQLWHFPNFEAARDGDTLTADLTRALTRPIGPSRAPSRSRVLLLFLSLSFSLTHAL